ncbi:MAG: rhodanese-like domain-containing protein [Myxococcales bacterium]
MKAMLAAVAVVAISVPVQALACDGHEGTASVEIKKVDVVALADLQKKMSVYVYDANSEKTRTEQGVIPGAAMLTSASQYDVEKELTPVKDAPLVFYCANEKCKASHVAAERAAKAGYTNVSVLPSGIKGWKEAGQKTAKPTT